MATDANLSYHSRSVWAGGREPITMELVDTNGVCFPGALVSARQGDDTIGGATAKEAVLADWEVENAFEDATNLSFLGVVMEEPDLDIDTAFAATSKVKVILKGCGAIVWIPIGTSMGALVIGSDVFVSNTVPGHGANTQSVFADPPIVDELTSAISMRVGTCLEVLADEAAVNWVRVLLN